MNFAADKQTTDELNLLGKYQAGSVFGLFNKVRTRGGERLMEQMLRHPLTDAEEINERTTIFRQFQQAGYTFPFNGQTVEQFAAWLNAGGGRTYAGALLSVSKKKLMAVLVRDEHYRQAAAGVQAAIDILVNCRAFMNATPSFGAYEMQMEGVRKMMSDGRLRKLLAASADKPGPRQIAYCGYLLRHVFAGDMERLLSFIYELDVYIAVGTVAKDKGFGYAIAKDKNSNQLKATGLRHPALEKAVGNDLSLDSSKNLLFLTGANMAGKSTLMKSVGIALYLAHAGFPVAAREMVFSVKDGLYSSINLPDNINLGYSHFYAEVLRVKDAAKLVSGGKNMLVMFDELFKGTNVKDACEGTLEVTKAFAGYSNCLFIISTHIIEAGEDLQGMANIRFGYMPTVMDGPRPRYTYQLTEGITEDRQGMLIIQNEGILEMLKVN